MFHRYVLALIAAGAVIVASVITTARAVRNENTADQKASDLQAALTSEKAARHSDAQTVDALEKRVEELGKRLEEKRSDGSQSTAPRLTGVTPETPVVQAGSPERSPRQEPPAVEQTQSESGIRMTLRRCVRSGSTAECEMLISNTGEAHDFLLYADVSRLIDQDGNQVTGTYARLGSETWSAWSARTTLPADVPVRAALRFEHVPKASREFNLAEIVFSRGLYQTRYSMKYHGVALGGE
jgi:hypothetical protein